MTTTLDRKFYPQESYSAPIDRFRDYLLSRIGPDSDVLDYGAGRGHLAQLSFKGHARFVAGIDPEPAVLDNPHLDDAQLLDLSSGIIPYPTDSFDVVFLHSVVEHLADPVQAFTEIGRVLKPGGLAVARTPNLWHYVALASSCTPHRFHEYYISRLGRDVADTFPTVYRCNTARAVRRVAEKAGLNVASIQYWEPRPGYLRLIPPLYLCGVAYERLLNSTEVIAHLRCILIFELQKPICLQ